MPSYYNFTLTDGTPLTTVHALEGNGTDNLSVPLQIIDVDLTDPSWPYITVSGDVTARFIDTFEFDITGDSPYVGTYVVSGASYTEVLSNGKTVTVIPLASQLVNIGYDIVGTVTGTSGSWIVSGPTNGNIQFFPTSEFTVTGNTLSAANTTYIVSSATTGNQFSVDSVASGFEGTFTVLGNNTKFFNVSTAINIANTSGYDQSYTVLSISLVSGNTVVQVAETIPVGTVVSVDTLITLPTPNTVIVVSGSIPAGAGADGTAHPGQPITAYFTALSSILVTPTTPHNYIVTFRVVGDYTSQFVAQSTFLPHNVLYNGNPYAVAFEVTSSSYIALTDVTEIIVNIVDNLPAMPEITAADTLSHQDVNFSSISSSSGSTGLLSATTYTATITVDGTPISISVLGIDVLTFTNLVTQLNNDLGTSCAAVLDVVNSRIRFIPTAYPDSTISISAGTLFASPLTNFTSVGSSVVGTVNSWLMFPVPAVPYGYVQYTVPTVNTSLQLLGPGSPTYNSTTSWGKMLQNNAIHMVENFKNTSAPVSPIAGQLWFNPSVPVLNAYDGASWVSIASTVWPVQSYIDMNNHPIARLTNAVTTYPYVASLTGHGNNDQEAVNLRTGDTLYIAKTGGSSASASVRSGTMTGSLNINGASVGGASTIGINVNSAPISLYGTSTIDFKTSSTGGITFEASTSGNINILGSGNVIVTNGNVTVGSGTDKVVIQNNSGSAPTVTYTTSTTGNSVVNLGNNKITNLYTPSSPLDATNKAYVDSLVNGIIWIQPVKDPNLFDDSLSAPPVVTGDSNVQYHHTYIVKSPGTGLWAGLDNRAVVYDSQSAAWVDILGRNVAIGDRFGVFCEPYENDPLSSLPAGGVLNKSGKIVTVATVAPYTYTDYTPSEPDAFTVTGSNPTINALTNSIDRSPHFGHSYTFRGTWGSGSFGTGYKWIEFSGPQMLVDGAGLKYLGNILNIGASFGITVNSDSVQVNQTDLDGVYLRRDGTVSMLGILNLNSYKISNLANPTVATDAVNKQFADATYVALAGSTMNSTANITFNGGQVLGLPTTPTTAGSATSKTYVDAQDALRLALAGGSMSLNANITLSGTGEVLGLPAVPTTAGSAVSKAYADTKSSDASVVHLAGTEIITGAKTFSATTTLSNSVLVTAGSSITLSGGSGELFGLPAVPTTTGSAASKAYVDTKSSDVSVVHLAGTEIITGAKTFSAATTMNNSLTLAANGSFTNLTASTSGFTVIGTAVSTGGAYVVSLTAGQNTAGIGGAATLVAGQGSTLGGNVTITGGIGSTTTGGNIVITSGAGPGVSTAGNILLTAGNASLMLDPQGVWKINNVAPSAVNQAIVSDASTPATSSPSWQSIAHRVAIAPVTSATAGNPGDWFADDTYFYVYGSTGWRRILGASF